MIMFRTAQWEFYKRQHHYDVVPEVGNYPSLVAKSQPEGVSSQTKSFISKFQVPSSRSVINTKHRLDDKAECPIGQSFTHQVSKFFYLPRDTQVLPP